MTYSCSAYTKETILCFSIQNSFQCFTAFDSPNFP